MTEQIDYDPNTVLEALNNKADRDLNNVTDGTYQVLTTKNITNCLTKIPQDIKLELSDGTLTLKAGSKIYYPDGTSVIIENDIQNQSISGNATSFIRYQGGLLFTDWDISKFSSGTTVPSGYTGWFFNTTEKTICFYNSGIKMENTDTALPLGITTVTTNAVISIDQVFNGFGYIGSTVFALPGVEGLIPNGRNTDDSLNNTKFKTTSVLTNTSTIGNITRKIGISSSGTLTRDIDYILDDENYLHVNTADGAIAKVFEIGSVIYDSTSRITSFNPKTTFQSLDRNDKEEIISWGMPDYSAGVSITYPYTAPSDGVIIASPQFRGGETTVMYIDDVQIFYMYGANPSYDSKHIVLPVNKGNKITLSRAYVAGNDKFYPMKGVV